jgi:hypothetical protein
MIKNKEKKWVNSSPRKIRKRKLHFGLLLLAELICNLVLGWGLNLGEDITNSRSNFLSPERNNFLGSFAGFVYGNFPDNSLHWWQALLLTQGTLTATGLYLLFARQLSALSKPTLITLNVYCFISICLGMAPTRDGAMISISLFGFSLIYSRKKSIPFQFMGVITLILAFGFRPWLGICLTPIFYLLFHGRLVKSKLVAVALAFFTSLAPVGLETLTAVSLQVENAYPQQTVMLHDMASSYCLSTNQGTRDAAFSELERNSNDSVSILQICEFYKPSTWQNIILPGNEDARISHLKAPIKIIYPGDSDNFDQLQKSWIRVIKNDPSTYIQNHLYFLSQILISGESRSLTLPRVIAESAPPEELLRIFKILCALILTPIELIIRLHLASPLVTIVGLVILFLRKYEPSNIRYVTASVLTLLLWVTITTVGFVSDNGRYTYLPLLLVWGTMICHKSRKKLED